NRAHDPNKFLFDDIPSIKNGQGSESTGSKFETAVKVVREGLEELVQAYPLMLHRLRDLMFAELQVPNMSPHSLAELQGRAANIQKLSGDFHVEAFVGRLAHIDGRDKTFEGIASLAVSKPPRDWTDPDLDAAAIEIAVLSQKFLRTETFARVKGRPEKRQAVAVLIGINGRPAPFVEEFEVAETDRASIADLIERVSAILDNADTERRGIVLAALAELSARYMRDGGQKVTINQEKEAS
ncbi:MAG: hypothetical protein ACR2OJ_17070, partial [Hyphomicrobiales bacterium]